MQKLKHTRGGFTLIELLVVISIIGLLASVVMASLNSARAKGRDARRIADLKQIQNALTLYYDDNGRYPTVGSWVNSTAGCNWIPGLAPTYISCVPQDPINTGAWPWEAGVGNIYAYGYPQGPFPQEYDLIARLENASNPQRCELRKWIYHTAGNPGATPWCAPGHGHNPLLYADH